ncbi:MAG: FRG domain-containing protein, partial [Spirochaetales bacterium]|nr:FRG domain-containing protein [Spirochaetales bacterium]
GVPTRLLDWSTDPYVALYFAAKSGIELYQDKHKDSPSSVALWAVNRTLVHRATSPQSKVSSREKYSFRFVEPPYFQDPNLAAQKGVFSLVRVNPGWLQGRSVPIKTLEAANRISFDDALLESIGSHDSAFYNDLKKEWNGLDPVLLRRISLPIGEVIPLLRSLRNMGYHAGSIYPGYKGCGESVKELALIKEYEASKKIS